jgi:hypothetical protein
MGSISLAFIPASSSRARTPRICRVVQSNKFDLVGTQAARTLGLSVPDKLLAVADAMIG